jgi:serine/threonine protein kinase
MPLRQDGYVGLADLLTGRCDATFSVVCRLSIELADSFLRLHSQGLCYRDISFGNVFFDPGTGVPLICDNDNVGIDGKSTSSVLGTRRFMAPEIVRRDAAPSTQTDLFSLAVLLFYILMSGHPLVGRRELEFPCWDDAAESVLFGRQPIFVFDPGDVSNAPLPDVHGSVIRFWTLYPEFLRELFVTAFTVGVHDPRNGRVRESVWRAALARLRDSIVRCDRCDRENFFDSTAPLTRCWCCGETIDAPLWLVADRASLAMSKGTVVHGHHLRRDYDFDDRIAEVAPHPRKPALLGLRNLSPSSWTATVEGGEVLDIQPGRSIRLAPGTMVDFGHVCGLIQDKPA